MIIIQKFILLLDDFYFSEFSSFLASRNAELPLKLVSCIRERGWNQPDSDQLCRMVYGEANEKEKRKFLQLTHHTFKLSSFLSRNYPSYLKPNLAAVEQLINTGQKEKANRLAELLADIAGKTEDFSTRLAVLKFFAQQAFITDAKDSVKFHNEINELLELERQQNEVYSYLRENFHYRKKENLDISLLGRYNAYFDRFADSPFFTISILARFGKYYELSFLNHPDFYKESTFRELDRIERDLQNNAFLVFPFLDDVLFKVMGLRLQWLVHKMDTDGILKESFRIIEESSRIRFWKSYVNVPELYAIAVQCSHYISHHGETFRSDFSARLPVEIRGRVNFLKKKLKLELERPIWNEGYIIKLIHVRSFYSALLLLGTREEIQEAVEMIEETFITYQQIPFQKFLDGMFAGLIIGYFSLGNYQKVGESYKRYRKATAGNSVNEENDLTISAYYYCSQWLLTGRTQYCEKLEAVWESCQAKQDLSHVGKLVNSLCEYFSVPLAVISGKQ